MKLHVTRGTVGFIVRRGSVVLHRESVGDAWTAAVRWARKYTGKLDAR